MSETQATYYTEGGPTVAQALDRERAKNAELSKALNSIDGTAKNLREDLAAEREKSRQLHSDNLGKGHNLKAMERLYDMSEKERIAALNEQARLEARVTLLLDLCVSGQQYMRHKTDCDLRLPGTEFLKLRMSQDGQNLPECSCGWAEWVERMREA